MDRTTRLAALKKLPSPFWHTAAAPAWAPRPPDVADLNAPALQALRLLIEAARPPAAPPTAALILGAAGSGKTHLIGSLHHRVALEGLCTVVEIRPPPEPARALRHLCAQLVAGLAYRAPGDPKPAPLARMLARAVASWLADDEGKAARQAVARRELDIVRQWPDISGQVSEWLQDRHPELWPPLLDVLIQYPIPARQPRTVQWMRGDTLADTDLAELGVQPEPGRSEADLENTAGWKIGSLTRLLALDRPLVIAFDGVERDVWRERRTAFNRMLELLLNHAHHTVVVAACRTDGWTRVAEGLEGGLRDRFTKRFELGGCSRAQVDALFARRLSQVPASAGGSDGTDLFPFDDPLSRHQLMDLAAAGRPLARDVVRKGRQMWVREVTGDAAEAPSEYLAAWLDERAALIERDLDRYPPEEGLLLSAMTWVLDHQNKESAVACEALFRPTGKTHENLLNARLRTRAGTFRYRFIASTRRDPIALAEPIFQALRLVAESELDIPVVVRDFRCPIPDYAKWPGGRSPLDALLDAGGYLLQLDRPQMARCWALSEMETAIQAQALEIISAEGDLQPITAAHMKAFLAEKPLFPVILSSLAACAARARDRKAKSS